ncbi:hypothetical protein AAKU58_004277 [Oxalobacteraceae bacterium GrIS 1.18]
MRSKTLIIVKKSISDLIKAGIAKVAVVGWENAIEIREEIERKFTKSDTKVQIEQNTNDLILKYSEQDFEKIIIQTGLLYDLDELKKEGISVKELGSKGTIIKEAVEELRQRNLYWLTHANNEWNKSSIRHTKPEVWVQQFADLGYADIGKHLLKSLRVISEADLKDRFKAREADNIGLRVAHAYIDDDEPGSSSISIKNILDHMYQPQDVIKINLQDLRNLETLDVDVLYVYEDGLWSGVELVKRLNSICTTEYFKKTKMQFHFKYGATTDVGLAAGRLFVRRNVHSRLQIYAGKPEYHFTFLKDGAINHISTHPDKSDNTIRTLLDSQIEPYAFRPAARWVDTTNATRVCKDIGRQLVPSFLLRRELEKNQIAKNKVENNPVKISEEKIMKWSLGALGFASTIVFSASIPKPVLPLMWLAGEIKLHGKTVSWKPLFWDVRRTGEVA